jgi:histidine ammonia-lyase
MELNGQQISLAEIAAVALGNSPVQISASARRRILASRKVIDVNTRFGKLADVRIPRDELRELQLNIVRSRSQPFYPIIWHRESTEKRIRHRK